MEPTCLNCGHALRPGARFCPACGTSQENQSSIEIPSPPPQPAQRLGSQIVVPGPACWRCGNSLLSGARFCSVCGAAQALQPIFPQPIDEKPQKSSVINTITEFFSKNDRYLSILALTCLVLFTLVQIIFVPIFNLSRQATNPNVYKKALARQNIYPKALGLFADQVSYGQTSDEKIFCEPLTPEDWQIISKHIFPTDWFRHESESVIDQFFSQAKTDDLVLIMSVNLTEFKNNLGGGPGVQAFKEVFQTKNACSDEQVTQAVNFVIQRPTGCVPRCQLPANLLERDDLPWEFSLIAIFWDSLDDVIASILGLASFLIPKIFNIQASSSSPVVEMIRFFTSVKTISLVLLLLSLPLIFGAFLSKKGRTLNGWLLFWGFPITLIGIVSIAASLIFVISSTGYVSGQLNDAAQTIAPTVIETTKNMVRSAALSVVLPLVIQALILVFVGGIMLGVWYFNKPKNQQPDFRGWESSYLEP